MQGSVRNAITVAASILLAMAVFFVVAPASASPDQEHRNSHDEREKSKPPKPPKPRKTTTTLDTNTTSTTEAISTTEEVPRIVSFELIPDPSVQSNDPCFTIFLDLQNATSVEAQVGLPTPPRLLWPWGDDAVKFCAPAGTAVVVTAFGPGGTATATKFVDQPTTTTTEPATTTTTDPAVLPAPVVALDSINWDDPVGPRVFLSWSWPDPLPVGSPLVSVYQDGVLVLAGNPFAARGWQFAVEPGHTYTFEVAGIWGCVANSGNGCTGGSDGPRSAPLTVTVPDGPPTPGRP
jgi:hypothetical protein